MVSVPRHVAYGDVGTEGTAQLALCYGAYALLHVGYREEHVERDRQQHCQQEQHRYYTAKYFPEQAQCLLTNDNSMVVHRHEKCRNDIQR